jgi:hypothetical protein
MYKDILVIEFPDSMLSLSTLALTQTQLGIVSAAPVAKCSTPITYDDIKAVMNLISTKRAIYLSDF